MIKRLTRFAIFSILLLIFLAGCQQQTAPASQQTAAPGLQGTSPTAANVPTQSTVSGQKPEIYEAGARVRYCREDFCLILEFLEDGLMHGEYAGQGKDHDLSQPLWTTPMVLRKDYPGPTDFSILPDGSLATGSLRITVDDQLCFSAVDTTRQPEWKLTRICPDDMEGYRKHLTIDSPDITDIYGLGEQFIEPGVTEGNWFGKVRVPGVDQGNAMVPFSGGMVGNAQFSVAYFLGEGSLNYALFIDDQAAQTWNLRKSPWDINVAGNAMRFYLMTGKDVPALRTQYMSLTGTPPVPPLKMFGLWISEYGFDNWEELEGKLATLRANNFPVDGFVLDLLWFGGITSDSENSAMGGLNWDTTNFPDPAGHIADYAGQGLGIMTIEEPYISAGLPEHASLAEKGYLVRQNENGDPVYLDYNPWWGIGGMVDWTNPDASAYWHDEKRQPLVDIGVIGHWTDLGEPEMFDAVSWYHGIPDEYVQQNNQFDVHNLYNFYWSQGINDGYLRNEVTQRPFILSRSGAPGIQRFGVSMWSGDIGSNLDSLAAHLQVQGQMSLSGIDYFGSDIGGFYRGAVVGGIENVYTPWLAAGTLLDVPVRPHTNNLCNCQETAPDRIGDVESNLTNVRLRYELSPYLYSLAHRAFLAGEPLFSPLPYYFQQDSNVRTVGNEKMIGRDLLAGFSSRLFEEFMDIYLPAGTWVDYHTYEWHTSSGEWLKKVPLVKEDVYQLPLFMRAGAIVPLMYVDDQTMNISGLRKDGSTRDELILRVVASPEPTSFILYEDDGISTAYRDGAVRTTQITQQQEGDRVTIKVESANGTYEGAALERDTHLQLLTQHQRKPREVTLNGVVLQAAGSREEWETLESGWYSDETGLLLVKTGRLGVGLEKVVQVSY